MWIPSHSRRRSAEKYPGPRSRVTKGPSQTARPYPREPFPRSRIEEWGGQCSTARNAPHSRRRSKRRSAGVHISLRWWTTATRKSLCTAQSALIAGLATGVVWVSVPALVLTRATNRRGSPFRQWGEVLRSWQLRLLRCLRLLRSTSPLNVGRHGGSWRPPVPASRPRSRHRPFVRRTPCRSRIVSGARRSWGARTVAHVGAAPTTLWQVPAADGRFSIRRRVNEAFENGMATQKKNWAATDPPPRIGHTLGWQQGDRIPLSAERTLRVLGVRLRQHARHDATFPRRVRTRASG